MTGASRTLVIARRELGAYLRSPVAWLVATLFLLVQGYAFHLYLTILTQRAAPLAWPLRYFFGGSFLFWVFLLIVAAVLTMRLVAEERRLGTIEPLLTAPVRPVEVVLGKYLGSLAFYAGLWAPTLAYVILLARLAPPGTSLDPGPIAGGYLGTLLVGAGALAVGLCASALTQHQLLAAVAAFLVLLLELLLGLAADAAAPGSTTRALLAHASLVRHMEDFARGVVDTRPFAWHLGLIAVALWAATRLVGREAASRAARWRAVAEVAALVGVVALGNAVAARHWRRADWTRAAQNSLAPRTVELLARLDAPVEAHVLMLPTGQPGDPYSLVRDLLQLYAGRAAEGRLRVDFVDPDREPDRLRALAARYGLRGDELEEGAVVFERADARPAAGEGEGDGEVTAGPARTRVVLRRELVETDVDDEGRPRLKAFLGERAFDAALLAVTAPRAPVVCFTRGHGELRVDSLAVDGASDWGEALRRSNLAPRTLDTLAGGVPSSCDVTVVAGAERPMLPSEIAALDALLGRGGRLLVLAGPEVDAALRPVRTGLEPLLDRWGVRLEDAVVFDPAVRMSTEALAWAVDDGYADHPATRALTARRTVWALARPLARAAAPPPGATVTELVRTSERAWGEVDLDAALRDRARLRRDDGRDLPGPLAVALAVEARAPTEARAKGAPPDPQARGASRYDGEAPGAPSSPSSPSESARPARPARLVVLGSKAIARNDHDVFFNRDLLESVTAWLAGTADAGDLGVAPQIPSELKLAPDEAELDRAFWICVVALPLACLLAGAAIWWRRRA